MGFKSVKKQFAKVKQKIAQEKEKPGSNYSNEFFFKPQAIKGQDRTKYRVRLLPLDDESSTGRPWLEVRYHMFERRGDNKYIKVIDPRTFDPKAENPIADLSSKLFGSDNALDKEMAKKLYRKPRFFAKLYIKEAPENQQDLQGKILIFEASKTLYDKWMDEIDETEADEAPFWDAFEGKDFVISIKEKGDWPDYSDSKFIGGNKPILEDEDAMDKLYEDAKKINIKDKILERDPIKSGSQLQELLSGGGNKSSTTSDEENNTAQSMTDDTEITTDNVDFGDDDIEDDKPAKSKSTSKEAVKDDAEDDTEFNDSELDDVDFSDEDFEV
jgi:hypothetical protein